MVQAEIARAAHLRHRTGRFDATDDPPTAVALAARRCALTPLDEPAHRTLIERLPAAGDHAGALLAGWTLAMQLQAELGSARPRDNGAAHTRVSP